MTEVVQLTDDELEQQLPRPVGYRVLIALPEIEKTYGYTSVLKTDKEIHHDYIMSIMGLVVDMGKDSYGDKERFPYAAWCKEGDLVMFRANSAKRFKLARKD